MGAPGPGSPKVLVNDGDPDEPSFLRCSREIILPALAFQVPHDLVLAAVKTRANLAMKSFR